MTSWATYGYDPVGRLAALTHDLAGAASDQALGFAYNPASQIVTRTSSNDAYAWTPPYNVSRIYAVNGLNQYTVVGGTGATSYSYDANGNLTSDGSTTFVYDAENRLVSATGMKNANLAYDPLGRLWQVSSAATGTTRFLYDGDRLAAEYDAAGNVLRAYAHGGGADEPLIWYEVVPGGTSRRFLHADHQGSIVAVADQNGASIALNSYDPWGVPGAGNQGRFGYTGQAWLPELGMYYYKARIYWPTIGRFMQTDPVGYAGGTNFYAYVGNDPVNGRDPSGLFNCAEKTTPWVCDTISRYVEGITISRNRYKSDSQEYNRLDALATRIGKRGDGNGVIIQDGKPVSGGAAEWTGKQITIDVTRLTSEIATSALYNHVPKDRLELYEAIYGGGLVGHEGDHSLFPLPTSKGAEEALERSGYSAQEMIWRGYGIRGREDAGLGSGETWIENMVGHSVQLWCRHNALCAPN